MYSALQFHNRSPVPGTTRSCVVSERESPVNFHVFQAGKLPAYLVSLINSPESKRAAGHLYLGVSSRVQLREARLLPLWLHVMGPEPGGNAAAFICHLCPSRVLRQRSVELTKCWRRVDPSMQKTRHHHPPLCLCRTGGGRHPRMLRNPNTKPGEVVRLPFVQSEMRFMRACSVANGGKFTGGAFGLFDVALSFGR